MKHIILFVVLLSTLLFSQVKEMEVKPVENNGGKPDYHSISLSLNKPAVAGLQMPPGGDTPTGMIWVDGGTFTMGSNYGKDDEKPTHQVTVNGFFIGKTEVTLESFSKFIQATGYKTDAEKGGYSSVFIDGSWKETPGADWRCDTKGNKRPDSEKLHPVIHVSWNDAVAYCNWLSEQEGLQKAYKLSDSSVTWDFNSNGYRLPTEAEWEYATNKGKEYKFSGSDNLDLVGWFGAYDNSGNRTNEEGTSEVGQKLPNELGVHDMSGNVYEWCWDWYDKDYYSSSPGTNPKGPDSGFFRALRGGSWLNLAGRCRVADRLFYGPGGRGSNFGFRLARSK